MRSPSGESAFTPLGNPGWKTMSGSASDPERRWIACGRRSWSSAPSSSPERSGRGSVADRVALSREERCQAQIGQIEQVAEIPPIERFALGRGLDFDEGTVARADDIAVDRGTAILDIIEVKNRHATDNPDAYCRDRSRERVSI